jgi:biotin synthase
MLTRAQAERLAEAGLSAYNHNLDTSPEFYGEIISTRTQADRLETLEHVRAAGISVCCGGILGLGESVEDRCRMLVVLATQPVHPESVPINALVSVAGTPLAGKKPPHIVEMVRAIAVARILMPHATVRLSAGREAMTEEGQLLCFLAGANSIFFGDKLLTTPNPSHADDLAMLARAGIEPRPATN